MSRPERRARFGQVARFDLDRRLVEEARRNPARFDALYRKYLAQIYSFAYYELRDHHAAEDATERTFMLALTGLPRFEERALDVDALPGGAARSEEHAPLAGAVEMPADASTFRVWLFQIARNVIANERRTQRRRPAAPLDAAGALSVSEDLADAAAQHEATNAAWRAVSRLPDDRRRVVVLRFVDEMSIAEIAAVMGRSEGAIRVLLHRALRSVAADLGEGLS